MMLKELIKRYLFLISSYIVCEFAYLLYSYIHCTQYIEIEEFGFTKGNVERESYIWLEFLMSTLKGKNITNI